MKKITKFALCFLGLWVVLAFMLSPLTNAAIRECVVPAFWMTVVVAVVAACTHWTKPNGSR
jgi:type III secretory pathway component EscT